MADYSTTVTMRCPLSCASRGWALVTKLVAQPAAAHSPHAHHERVREAVPAVPSTFEARFWCCHVAVLGRPSGGSGVAIWQFWAYHPEFLGLLCGISGLATPGIPQLGPGDAPVLLACAIQRAGTLWIGCRPSMISAWWSPLRRSRTLCSAPVHPSAYPGPAREVHLHCRSASAPASAGSELSSHPQHAVIVTRGQHAPARNAATASDAGLRMPRRPRRDAAPRRRRG